MPTPPKTTPKKRAGTALRPVHVDLTVGHFVDVLTTELPHDKRSTSIDSPKLSGGHSNVSMAKTKKGRIGAIRVTGSGAIFCFHIKSRNRHHSYVPVGIAFRRRISRTTDNDREDVLGRKNFSPESLHIDGHTLYITDNFKDCGENDRYKFSIIIQRRRDAAIGIIDPDLIHGSTRLGSN